ncbi:hypothetical protein VHEMI09477 [[Torrubiella] hemipterigena]|uniref:Peroxisomal ATPase PEX1 n=1 Tax=[Torrubiella] hemipterigena TaxID=1531966 RepID=A0A0A1TRJ3_9HYPO|nr:hypothetical protein VHEMI09477 [[Torrubiella] hemipterigena]
MAYEAIKSSNSSLSRQKKRPLEDAIDRVLQVRSREREDSEDSEAALEEDESEKPQDERFLLNRQMVKHWNVEPASQPTSEPPSKKKRRVETDDEDTKMLDTPQNGTAPSDTKSTDKTTKEQQKKTPKATRYTVEENVALPPVGGLSDVYRSLLGQTGFRLRRPELYRGNSGLVPGILLSGPPGVGKKSLIRTLAAELSAPIVSLKACFQDPERMEKSLTEAVDAALSISPSIVFIEDLHLYMGKPGGSTHNEHHQKAIFLFERQMERIAQHDISNGGVLAMATTSRLTDIDPTVLRYGLFERTVPLRVPDRDARVDILKVLTRDLELAENVDFTELAKLMHGFVGADIATVIRLARQASINRIVSRQNNDYDRFLQLELDGTSVRKLADGALDLCTMLASYPESSPDDTICAEDFKSVIGGFVPSLRKEGFTVVPSITWDQVGALRAVRDQLNMSIIGPIKDPELYRAFGMQRPAGALLWGPPGCGKTLVAQAVANEAQASFILINGPELLNKYVGESERAVRELFQRARSSTPCILFFDEIDSIVPRRENSSTDASARVVNALLTELDGAQDRSGIYVIGTTNRPDMIDSAMLRPGRLSVRLFVDLPTADERVDILNTIYKTCHSEATAAELARLPGVALDPRCHDFSGADLGGLHTKAAESALRRWMTKEKTVKEIDEVDWETALESTQRSVSNPETYRKLNVKLGKAN